MTIHHHAEANGKGSWFVEVNGERLAELGYHITESGDYSLDSTRVDDSLRGKNVGKQLVEAAVTSARQNGVKVIPVCPFVVALFEKILAYSDVKA